LPYNCNWTRIAAAALLGVCACLAVYGQATSGNIIGTVTDPAGAVIQGVKIKITSQNRGVVYNTTTNESGNYSQLYLLPGPYTVEFEASGFERYQQTDVIVSLDRSTRVDAQLTVGQVSEQISVVGTAPPLVTDRAEVSSGLSSLQVNQLPTLNRNFTALELLMPGAQKMSWQHATSENPQQGMQINVNGQRFGAQNFMIDGADNNDPVLGIIVVNPAIDSVAEFKYTTGNYDAEYAQAGGAVMQTETKSGTNEFHGSLFEFLQNNKLNARNPFSEPNGPPPLRWNEFGGSFGGPIKKNKLFFFGDYQGFRRRTGGSLVTTTPTAAERNGDFSALGVPIFDPTSGNADGTGRVQFPGNKIPPSQISPVATNLLALLPPPNFGSGFNNNYIASGSEAFDSDQFDVRADEYVKDNFRYFGRYSHAKFHKISPAAFGPVAGGNDFPQIGFSGVSDVLNQNVTGGFNYVLGPTLLTDFRFGYLRYRVNVQATDFGKNQGEAVGIPGVNFPGRIDTSGLPEFQINGAGGFNEGFGLGIDQCNCPLREREWRLQFVDTWTKIHGNHTIKWGTDIGRAQNLRAPSDHTRNGYFQFGPTVTASADVPGSGLGPASFLLGMPNSFQRFWQTVTQFPEDTQWRMYYFVQDTWRATTKLTISYGLRWDTWFPDKSTLKGGGSDYNVNTNNFEIVGIGGNSMSANVTTQWHNFSPRLAIAYALNSKTVIRTGWGRSYFEEIFGANFNNIAYNYPTVISQTPPQVNPFTPLFLLSDGPPAPQTPQIPSNGLIPLTSASGLSASYIPRNLKYPNVDSWNFSVERLIAGDLTATVSYVGNVGRHLQWGVPLNAAVPGPGPFDPRRPLFQKFGINNSVNDASNAGSNNYNSLQTKLTKRFSHGLSLLATFTWSKALGDAGGLPPALGEALTYGPLDWDRKYAFTLGHVWQLPFGPGRAYLSNVHGVAKQIVAGWEFSGITQFESGWPFSPGLNNNASLNADFGTPPNVVPGVNPYDVPGGQSRDLWFNPAAYTIPGLYQYGNAAHNSLRGPNLFSADWSFAKRFPFTETKSLQFRWEFFNIFNRTNLANPNGAIDAGAGSAGVITGLSNPMRQMQVGLRFEF
jgi:hypothetical protein